MAILKVKNCTGKYQDSAALHNVIKYIMDEKKTRGVYVGSCAVADCGNADTEMSILSRLANKDDGVRLRHFIISFDPEILPPSDPEAAFAISREIADYYGDEYQIVYAMHVNKGYLHTHFVMNQVSYITGKKYSGSRTGFYDFLSHCQQVFVKYGVNDTVSYSYRD